MDEPTNKEFKKFDRSFRVEEGKFEPGPLGPFPYMYDITLQSYEYDSQLTKGRVYVLEQRDMAVCVRDKVCVQEDGAYTCDHYHIMRSGSKERVLAPGEKLSVEAVRKPYLARVLKSNYLEVLSAYFPQGWNEETWQTHLTQHRLKVRVAAVYREFDSMWQPSKDQALISAYAQVYLYCRDKITI